MAYLFSFAIFIVCLLIIIRSGFFKNIGLTKYDLSFYFGLKVLTGIALYSIYTYYYTDRLTADIFKYFDDGAILRDLARNDFSSFFSLFFGLECQTIECQETLDSMRFWSKSYNFGLFNDNQTIIRLNALIHFISFGNYQIHNILFNFLSFMGLIAIWKFLKAKFPVKKWMLILCLFLFPTVLLWTSGVLKESILIFALGFFLYFFFVKEGLKYKGMAIIFLALLFGIKPYVIISLLPGFVILALLKIPNWKPVKALIIGLVLTIGLGLLIHFFSPMKVMDLVLDKQQVFSILAKANDAGSLYYFPEMKSYSDLFIYAPLAFFNTLFRPFIWEANGMFSVLAALENLLIIAFLFVLVFAFKKRKLEKWELFLILFIAVLSVLIGLTTPVFGAMVRYKMPLMPFLLILIFMRINYQKIYNKLPFLKSLENL